MISEKSSKIWNSTNLGSIGTCDGTDESIGDLRKLAVTSSQRWPSRICCENV